MFTLEGPHIVMSRTDAQNGLDFPTLIFDSMDYAMQSRTQSNACARARMALASGEIDNRNP
jgi:hypothetical protein